MSQLFNCKVGTMQGCISSPFFFVLFYINELIRECKDFPGVKINGDIDINMLLYADDLVIVGDNVGYYSRSSTKDFEQIVRVL